MAAKVLRSIQNESGDRCIDVFRRDDGTFGFDKCRRDVEDGEWFPLHRYSAQIFDSEQSALAKAEASVAWLKYIRGQ